MAAIILTAVTTGNGKNSANYTYTGGAGAGDTITNGNLLNGVTEGSRLYTLLNTSYETQAALDAALAAAGFSWTSNGGVAFRLVTAAPGKPTATMTGTVTDGSLRISIAHSSTR